MTLYEIVLLFGIPSICVLLWTYLFRRVKENDTQSKATKKGIQALLLSLIHI